MFTWIANNIWTIVICVVLLAVIGLAVRSLVRDKKKGKSSCGCNCAHCAMAGACHGQKEQEHDENHPAD